MFLPWLTVFDFANIRANFVEPLDLHAVQTRSRDFALLVPIFNDLKYLTNIDFLKRYADRVILCTTDHETPEFIAALEALCEQHGFRASYSPVEGGVKNPWAIYHKTLLAHDAVLKSTVERLDEKYVIFIDGDTYVDGDLEVLVGAMQEREWDLASVRVLPSRRKTVIEHLQGVEYDIAMRARLLYPWLTSGAGMIAQTQVMGAIMDNHSLFFNGGDIEIGKLADMMGFKVGHIPMVFYTDIPETFGKWVKQRRSWMCGMFRHSIINIEHNLHHPFHFIYFSFIIYLLYPFKLAEMIQHPHLLPVILLLYMAATYVANWKVRSRWMLLFPLYALFQVLVLLWLGIYRYAQTVRKTGNFGKIHIRRAPALDRLTQMRRKLQYAQNLMTVAIVVTLIVFGSLEPVQTLVFGQPVNLFGLLGGGIELAWRDASAALADVVTNATLVTPTHIAAMLIGAVVLLMAAVTGASLLPPQPYARRSPRRREGQAERSLRKAAALHQRAIECDPSSAGPYYAMARLLMRQNKLDSAMHYYTRAIYLDAQAGHGITDPTRAFEMQNQASVRHLLSQRSRPGETHARRASVFELVQDRALAQYLQAAGLSPSLTDLSDFRRLSLALTQSQSDVRTVRSRALIDLPPPTR
jgi:tetratricopeptide (TPR) repeat protein